MPTDPFTLQADNASSPSRAPFAVVPNDTDPLPLVPKALYIGTGGDVVLRGAGGSSDVVFRNVASGQVIDVRASYVRATGTSAADIVALA